MDKLRFWYEPKEAERYENEPVAATDGSCPRCRSTLNDVIISFQHVSQFEDNPVEKNFGQVLKCKNCGQVYRWYLVEKITRIKTEFDW